MHTLFARLSLALLAIVTLTGGAVYFVEQYSTRNYHEEITQRLNSSIAMYVTDERQLMADGVVDQEALAHLAQQAMVINPTVEIYLLDRDGRVIWSAGPDEGLQADAVDLSRVTALLEGGQPMPLRGTDPRSDREKVFSAHPVMHEGALEGYLYAILGGQTYDALANSIRGSYVRQVSLGALLAILAAAFFVGLLVFGLLTRRLERLTSDVRRFTDSGFDPEHALATGETTGADEISQLREACGRMSQKILQQFDDLKETDRLRRELISNVSHDLRTPLSSMHGFVETLLIKNDTLDADERRHYLEITRKHTQRLGQLIGDLFELSKLESASIRPNLEPFSLAELLHDVAQEFELDAERKGISLVIETPSDQATVLADIGLVQRVLENLLRNALKYTPRGGEVRLSLQSLEQAVSVAVADSGCGIAEEDLERIFDRFYQGDTRREEDKDSAGLGLAIVRKILDLHGSRITVTSRPEEGTRFEFQLPVRAAA